ncbi:hypothetical protein CTKZ_21590 [Cellulomonas algicola]|uniref:Uncharacterized protein n=1 Tax=Cellulomonas algicola TaxID=2071633 RepID=A0A401V110_9CELL|nr:hypothetical protein CTKZ_21590 [Cellulomonas algicola]
MLPPVAAVPDVVLPPLGTVLPPGLVLVYGSAMMRLVSGSVGATSTWAQLALRSRSRRSANLLAADGPSWARDAGARALGGGTRAATRVPVLPRGTVCRTVVRRPTFRR